MLSIENVQKKLNRPICILPSRQQTPSAMQVSFPFPSRWFCTIPISFPRLSPKTIVNKLQKRQNIQPEKKQKKKKKKKTKRLKNRRYKNTQDPHLRNTFCIVSSGMFFFPPFVRFVCKVVDPSCC